MYAKHMHMNCMHKLSTCVRSVCICSEFAYVVYAYAEHAHINPKHFELMLTLFRVKNPKAFWEMQHFLETFLFPFHGSILRQEQVFIYL